MPNTKSTCLAIGDSISPFTVCDWKVPAGVRQEIIGRWQSAEASWCFLTKDMGSRDACFNPPILSCPFSMS